MESMTQWTRVWANSGRQCWTKKSGMLQSVDHSVRPNLAPEQQQRSNVPEYTLILWVSLPLKNHCYKTHHQILLGWDTVWRGESKAYYIPFAWQSNKAFFFFFFCFIQNSVSKIWFGTARQRWQRLKWWDCITNPMDMSLSQLQEIEVNWEAWCAAVHEAGKNWQ